MSRPKAPSQRTGNARTAKKPAKKAPARKAPAKKAPAKKAPAKAPAKRKAPAKKAAKKPPPKPDLPTGDWPDLPENLADLPGAAELWAELWQFGGDNFRPPHRQIIERYVVGVIQRVDLINKLGGPLANWTVEREGYGVVPHPNARRIDAIEQRLLQSEKELGLTPEAAIRLGLTAEKASALEAFIDED